MDIDKDALNQDNIKMNYMKKMVKPESTNKIHCHPYYRLMIKERGCVRYTTNGSVTEVKESCIVFMPAYFIYNPFVQETEIYERFKIEFDLNFAKGYIKNDEILLPLIKEPYIKPLSKHEFDEINIIAKSLYELKNKSPFDDTDRFCECMYLIMLLKKGKDAVSVESECQTNYIGEVIKLIKNNFSKQLTIENIADKFYVSKSKLIYDFKSFCNMNILEYITMTRVETAKECLLSGKSVAETSEICGFSSPSYFIKVFSSVTGMTPLKFRRSELN